jgi:hypothetical protein
MKHSTSIWPRLALVAAGLGLAIPAGAHHSFAMFNREKLMTLEGELSKVEWWNPHAYLYVDVTDPKGETKKYILECASPNELTRRGWKMKDLKVGETVTVQYYPLRDERLSGGVVFTVTLANGTLLKAN